MANVPADLHATLNFQHITKGAEAVTTPEMIVPALRRAFSLARNGRPGPCLIEVSEVFRSEIPSIKPVGRPRLRAHEAHSHRPDLRADRCRGRGLDLGENAAHLRGSRRALCESVDRAQPGRPVPRGAGGHQHGGQERLPRDPSAVPWCGRRDQSRALATHVTSPMWSSALARASARAIRSDGRRRASASSTTRWTSATSTRSFRPKSDAGRCEADARDAVRGAQRAARGSRAVSRATSPHSSRAQNAPVAEAVDADLTSNAKPLSPYRVI